MGEDTVTPSRAPDAPTPDELLALDPGASRRRTFRFSLQVAALTLATVLLTGLLAAAALLAIDPPRDTATELRSQILPAYEELLAAATDTRNAQLAFASAIADAAPGRAALLAQTQSSRRSAAEHLARFERLSMGRPGEQRLLERYDELREQLEQEGVATFGLLATADPAAVQAGVVRTQMLGAEVVTTLDRIRERFYAPLLDRSAAETADGLDDSAKWIVAVAGVFALFVVAGGVVLYRGARGHERVLARHESDRRDEERRANLETQLQRGLEMEQTERAAYGIVAAALRIVRPDHFVEMLVADSSRAHFEQACVAGAEEPGFGCAVASPFDCPATTTGQTRVFLSSARLDACPYLRDRGGPARSAVCVPMNIAGETTGVVHTTGPDFVPADPGVITELELTARKASDRIGFLRVLARSQMQARLDPLTGLPNRRSLEDQAHVLVQTGDPFMVAYADLDHFKQLNDTYGHEMGDRALRLFGRVLRDTLRPGDVSGRFGGEEFVILLPEAGAEAAHSIAQRLQDRLREASTGATVPSFTVSVGLAAWEAPEDFGETVARADAAMLRAKQTGRNRIVASAELADTATVTDLTSAKGNAPKAAS